MSKLNDKLQNVYETLPKMESSKCHELCSSGKCRFECCTISGCSEKEAKNINDYIKKNNLSLPLVEVLPNGMYLMPFAEDVFPPTCVYITKEGCAIYEVRPAICRLFGAVKQMVCTHQPDQAKTEEYPLEAMEKIGMLPMGTAKKGQKRFNEILEKQNKPTLAQRVLGKLR